MRKCYFCGSLKELKSIWMEECDVHEGHMEDCHHACCRHCYKDNELEDWEEHYEFWFNTDYNWESKKNHEVVS